MVKSPGNYQLKEQNTEECECVFTICVYKFKMSQVSAHTPKKYSGEGMNRVNGVKYVMPERN